MKIATPWKNSDFVTYFCHVSHGCRFFKDSIFSVITVALPVKNDSLLSSGISLKRLTEATIPVSFQSWSKAPRLVLFFPETPSKSWGLVKPPPPPLLFWKFGWRFKPPPKQKVGVHTMSSKLTGKTPEFVSNKAVCWTSTTLLKTKLR